MWIFLLFTLASAKSLEETYLLHRLTRQKQLVGEHKLHHICDPNISKESLLKWLSIPTQLHNTNPPPLSELNCTTGNKIYDVFMFSHELDTLEIRLFELWDIVDEFHIIENTFDFHGLQQKPVLFGTSRMSRFERFKSKMFFHINNGTFNERKGIDWSFEEHSTSFAVNIANSLDGIVIFGHVDEIPLRESALKLKSCNVKMPLNFASWMPLGNVKDKFKSDFPARGYPYSIGEPSAAYGKNIRGLSRGKFKQVLFGGFHATNYCFMPASLYKEMTATEYTHRKTLAHTDCLSTHLTSCLSMLNERKKPVQSSDHLKLPWIIDQNRDAYAAWFGKIDSRLLKTVHIDCYFITSFIQEHNIYMYPETEKRLHHLCPSVSAHIVNGEKIYEGVVATMLNRLGDFGECVDEEIEILSRVGIQC